MQDEKKINDELDKQLIVFARSFLNNPQLALQIEDFNDRNQIMQVMQSDKNCFVITGFEKTLIRQTKGAIDEIAGKIKLCDNSLLRSYNFLDASDFEILKIFENWRTNQIIFKTFCGCKKNILLYKQFCLKNSTINDLEAALYNLNQHFNNVQILHFKNQMQQDFSTLKNQQKFLQECYKLIQSLTKSNNANQASSTTKQSDANDISGDQQDNNEKLQNGGDDQQNQQQVKENWDDDMSAIVDFIKNNKVNDKNANKNLDSDSETLQNKTNKGREKISVKNFKYEVFTKNFDKIAKITELTTKDDKKLKDILNQDIKSQIKMQNKDIKNLIKKLSGVIKTNYIYDTEDGLLDKRKLKDLILQKSDGNIFFRRSEVKKTNVAITILVDNSGSMRGRLIKISAMACYLVAKVLSQFNINFEVLGFTTKHWQGGDSFEAYNNSQHSKSKLPGRVSDILHIIYKSFLQNNSANAIANIALMQKDSLLKENIDGEALQWAYKRLLAQKQQKKILIVISDGTPIDDATIALNGKNYLTNHLLGVVDEISQQKKVELLAIGIMHDVTKFYDNAIKINSVDDLSSSLFNGICKLL